MKPFVLDTNIVLDLFVFADAATASLQQALNGKTVQWLATGPMRDELARVLAYPHIVKRLAAARLSDQNVLAQFDQLARLLPVAPRAKTICQDPDDQKFIDLAVQHQATLLSKDNAVLCMGKRLQVLGINARTAM